MPDIPCRFGCAHAVVEVVLSAGCACHPDDRRQALCMQHYVKATPLGTMVLARVIEKEAWEWHMRQMEALNHGQRMVKQAMRQP